MALAPLLSSREIFGAIFILLLPLLSSPIPAYLALDHIEFNKQNIFRYDKFAVRQALYHDQLYVLDTSLQLALSSNILIPWR